MGRTKIHATPAERTAAWRARRKERDTRRRMEDVREEYERALAVQAQREADLGWIAEKVRGAMGDAGTDPETAARILALLDEIPT